MLVLKNRTTYNSLFELDATCFTKSNAAIAAEGEVLPAGVLGGSVAALKSGSSYVVEPADGANVPIGLFVNNAAGNPFENSPAVASNKVAIAAKFASVEVDVYEDVVFAVGDKLYASANGVLTNVEPAGTGDDTTVIGICTKTPTATDPFLGLEMRI